MDRITHSASSSFWSKEQDWFCRNRADASKAVVGHRKAAIWRGLLWRVPRDISVLEVGSGEGVQLGHLERLGFCDLYGCDVNTEALNRSPYPSTSADASALPFPPDSFDLVITSGLLIHIEPARLAETVRGIARVARHWVAGYEYHSPIVQPIVWRGSTGLLWKADYPVHYERAGLSLAKLWLLPHIDGSGNVDSAFLLTK